MTTRWPALLWGLLLVPVALGAYLLAQRRRARAAVRFPNLDLLAEVAGRSSRWRRHLAPALYLLALAVLLAGLARPQAPMLVPRERATVMLVMDVSHSMEATDVKPTRLAAAQQAAISFAKRLPARLRIGVVSFADNAHVVLRPTTDRAAVDDAIAALRARGGTSMGDGLERALDVKRAPPPPEDLGGPPGPEPPPSGPDRPPVVVLLLSDGASDLGDTSPQAAATDAKRLSVPVFTVALGSDRGMVGIPSFGGRSYSTVVPPDPATLQAIADTTGGRFYHAPTSRDLSSVYRRLGSQIGFVRQWREVTVVFAAAGLLLFVAALAVSLLRSNRFP